MTLPLLLLWSKKQKQHYNEILRPAFWLGRLLILAFFGKSAILPEHWV